MHEEIRVVALGVREVEGGAGRGREEVGLLGMVGAGKAEGGREGGREGGLD